MKEQVFEILKVLLLEQSAGGGLCEAIDKTIGLYAEIIGKDKEQLIEELKRIQKLAWGSWENYSKEFKAHQELYSILLNQLKQGE